MRAAAITPAEPAGARVVRFPADGSLPRETGGSASALSVSRPARRSLALRPAWSLSRPRRPFLSKCFRRCRCLHHPLRLLPAGTTVRRAGFAPAGGWCLSTAHSLILIVAPQSTERDRCADVQMGDQDVVEALSGPGRLAFSDKPKVRNFGSLQMGNLRSLPTGAGARSAERDQNRRTKRSSPPVRL